MLSLVPDLPAVDRQNLDYHRADDFSAPTQPLSVAGLSDYLKDLLEEDDRLHQVWVVGEVSSAKDYPSGLYFSLADREGEALLNAVVWRAQAAKLGIRPQVGQQVIVLGTVQVWPRSGQYKLVVWQVLPAGAGLQALRLKQLRDRLAAEGLFDPEHKRPLPPHPRAIAVVTSPQAAAWGDIQRTLGDRYPGLPVLFSPALVQGDRAPASLVAAIERVVADGRAEVLILARGGGASEDLAAFNDERLVRTVATCPIPVVTGIGHQRDESLCDAVADWCAATPTAAAERAVPHLSELAAELAEARCALQAALVAQLRREGDRLGHLRRRLALARPDRQLSSDRRHLAQLQQRAIAALTGQVARAGDHQAHLRQALAALDPAAVLQRGYALLRQENGAIVRHSQDLAPQDVLEVQLAQGRVRVRVEEILG